MSGRLSRRNQRPARRPDSQHGVPRMVFADEQGCIFDDPRLAMAGASGTGWTNVRPEDLIPLPDGSTLFTMPGRAAVGWDDVHGEFRSVEQQAVAAFIAPGFTRLLLPAVRRMENRETPILPLWAYTAVGFAGGRFWVPALRTDLDERCEPYLYRNDEPLTRKVRRRLEQQPHNRLLQQLARCALEYHCFAAKNTFNLRWELPLPTSPACPARCLGCISLQPAQCCPSSQERIPFVPTPEEIVEIAGRHLREAPFPIVSFGQGCEGEPLMQAPVLEQAVKLMRQTTSRGTINLNTNGYSPDAVDRLCRAGLDSIRFTIPSAVKERFLAYMRPTGFSFEDVCESIAAARRQGLWISLNLLVMPGVTDQPDELDALERLFNKTAFNMVQMRNLNIDPEYYLQALPELPPQGMGLRRFMTELSARCPGIRYGYYNPLKESFGGDPVRIIARSRPETARRNLPHNPHFSFRNV